MNKANHLRIMNGYIQLGERQLKIERKSPEEIEKEKESERLRELLEDYPIG